MQQPMQNPEDISDPTTAIDMALALMAKAFTLNDTTPTNNNQRSCSECGLNSGVQNVGNYNGLSVDPGIANQYGVGNFIIARAEANGNGINGN
ncbi:hypothetical protein Tco_0594085 [Tanacetum coccineum]